MPNLLYAESGKMQRVYKTYSLSTIQGIHCGWVPEEQSRLNTILLVLYLYCNNKWSEQSLARGSLHNLRCVSAGWNNQQEVDFHENL